MISFAPEKNSLESISISYFVQTRQLRLKERSGKAPNDGLSGRDPGPRPRVLAPPSLPPPPHSASLSLARWSWLAAASSKFRISFPCWSQWEGSPRAFLIGLWLPDFPPHEKGFISWHLIPFLIQSLFSITPLGFLLVLH